MNELRVYHIINPPNNSTYHRVNSIEEAVKKIRELARQDLTDPRIEINVFGLQEFDKKKLTQQQRPFDKEVIESCWEEWYDEGGFDIQQVMDGESDYYDENGVEDDI